MSGETNLLEWAKAMPAVQDIEWQLKKAEAIKAWCLRDLGFSVGDRVRIARRVDTNNGWKPYRGALAVGATAVVKDIDFNPYSFDGEGAWHASIVLDREWSESEELGKKWWYGPFDETPEGFEPPSNYDREHYPEGRKHTFSMWVGSLEVCSDVSAVSS